MLVRILTEKPSRTIQTFLFDLIQLFLPKLISWKFAKNSHNNHLLNRPPTFYWKRRHSIRNEGLHKTNPKPNFWSSSFKITSADSRNFLFYNLEAQFFSPSLKLIAQRTLKGGLFIGPYPTHRKPFYITSGNLRDRRNPRNQTIQLVGRLVGSVCWSWRGA